MKLDTNSYSPIQHFLNSIKHPSPQKIKLPVAQKLETVFLFLSINFVIQIFLGICVSLVLLLMNSATEISTQNGIIELFKTMSFIELILIGGIVLPLIEEIGFRLPMVFKPFYVGLSSSYFLFILYTFYQDLKVVSFSINTIYAVIACIIVGALVTFILSSSKISKQMNSLWAKHFIWVFYGFTLLFGLFHISNYTPLTKTLIFVSPILILPQITSGIIIGYLRTKFGFLWGCLFHGLWNSVLISLVYLLISFISSYS